MRAAAASVLICVAAALGGAGCPHPGDPKPPAPVEDADPAPAPLRPTGIVERARVRPLSGGNLTRSEARVTVRVLLDGEDVSDRSRVELGEVDGPADAPPVAAGAAGEPLGAPPGAYRVQIRLQMAETAVGQGGVARLHLGQAEQLALTLDAAFPTGTLLLLPTNGGRPVAQSTEVTVVPLSEAGPDAAAPRGRAEPLRVPAGRAVLLPAGHYEVRAVLRSPDGEAREKVERVHVEPDRVQKTDLEFGRPLAILRLRVTDETGADLTAESTVTIRSPAGETVGQGQAALDHTIPPGRYDLEVVWKRPPFARARAQSRNVAVTVQSETLPVPIQVRARLGQLTLDTEGAEPPCALRLARAEAGGQGPTMEAAGTGPFDVPAGTWDAQLTCQNGQRTVSGLVITPGGHLTRRLVLE